MNFDTDGWGQPFSAPGSGMLPASYGLPIVSEGYYDKISERVEHAQSAVAQAESGKRISDFRGGPYNPKFFTPPVNYSDAFAHVAYWLAVAAMATGNRKITTAASHYANSADTWSSPFLRMRTGGISQVYRGGATALRTAAGADASNPTVKYVGGVFLAQGNPAMAAGARERARQQDPLQMVSDAAKKTLTTPPDPTRVPWWVYGIAGTAVLGIVLYLTAGKRSAERVGSLISRRKEY